MILLTEDNMKKILAFILAIAAVLALGGCMSTGSKTATATDPADSSKIVYSNYDCTLEGLCNYLDDLGYMVFDYDASKDEAGTATIKMQADMIGAEKGYKSTYTYDKGTWAVEVYYYKDTTSDMYKEAQTGTILLTEEIEDGSFEITINNQFALVVNGPDDKAEREDAIVKAFKSFYPEGK